MGNGKKEHPLPSARLHSTLQARGQGERVCLWGDVTITFRARDSPGDWGQLRKEEAPQLVFPGALRSNNPPRVHLALLGGAREREYPRGILPHTDVTTSRRGHMFGRHGAVQTKQR